MNQKSYEAIFVIHNSPWQAVNALEAIRKYNLHEDNVFILIFVNEQGDSKERILEVVKGLNSKSQIISYRDSFAGKLKRYRDIIRFQEKCEILFFAQMHVRWMNLLVRLVKYDKLVFFDEGTHTLEVIKDICSNKVVNPPDEIFTAYHEQAMNCGVKVVVNSMDCLKGEYGNLKKGRKTWFVGQPLYKAEISMKDQVRYIKAIKDYVGEDLIYIPHRYDSLEFLEHLKKMSIPTLHPKSTIERLVLEEGEVPKRVVGFFSSALISLNRLLGSRSKVVSVPIEPEKIVAHRRERTSLFYKQIGQEGIELLEVGIE